MLPHHPPGTSLGLTDRTILDFAVHIILYILVAQGESEVKSDGMPNDLERELVTGIGDGLHAPTLTARQPQSPAIPVTMPARRRIGLRSLFYFQVIAQCLLPSASPGAWFDSFRKL